MLFAVAKSYLNILRSKIFHICPWANISHAAGVFHPPKVDFTENAKAFSLPCATATRKSGGQRLPPSEREGDHEVVEGACVLMERVLVVLSRTLLQSRVRSTALASARSRSGSDTTPWCHSLPSRRFATSRREPLGATAF